MPTCALCNDIIAIANFYLPNYIFSILQIEYSEVQKSKLFYANFSNPWSFKTDDHVTYLGTLSEERIYIGRASMICKKLC